MELLSSAVLGGDTTVPTEWVSPPAKELSGTLPWYKSRTGSAAAQLEYPGIIVISGTSTEAVLVEFRGVYEFKSPAATANVPLLTAPEAKSSLGSPVDGGVKSNPSAALATRKGK